MKMMPSDPHEFELMLRREYERGVEDAAVLAQSAVDAMPARLRMEIPVSVFNLGIRMPRELLSRSTDTQRTMTVLESMIECINEGLSIIMEPENCGMLRVVVIQENVGDTKREKMVVSKIDSIFKLTDVFSYSRSRLKGLEIENKRTAKES